MPKQKHYHRETRYVSVLTVHVSGIQGLLEMMRYDRCCPYTEDDSHKIMAILAEGAGYAPARGHGLVNGLGNHVVQLARYSLTDLPATAERWRSFNCTVLDERSPKDAPITAEEARARAATLGVTGLE